MSGKQHAAGSKTLLVTGAYPPDVCGVGEYTQRLAQAAPAQWDVLVERRWSLRNLPGILRRIKSRHPRTVVLQYPTQGYGWSLVPHLLLLAGTWGRRFRSVLALHEFQSLSAKAQLAIALASHWTSHVVFTTETELAKARAHPLFSRRVPTSIVPIISNIPLARNAHPPTSYDFDVAYFGHIRPNKGIETFLAAVAELRSLNPSRRAALIGAVPAGYEDFASMVEKECERLGCHRRIGLPDADVAALLARTRLLYLPFPDGVSARRGSVLAGLGNGCLIATTIGPDTSDALRRAVIACSGDPSDALTLEEALAQGSSEQEALRMAGRDYLSKVLPRDWAEVAALYRTAL